MRSDSTPGGQSAAPHGHSGPNHLNVFAGEDSMKQYYNPDCHPHLPLVELPASLNPFREDGVRIYAKMMTFLPAHNVKALPALNMLQSEAGLVRPETTKVVEYSSGSTVISMAVLSRVLHGIDDVHAYLSNKTSETKLKLMQFFGLKITVFGGPSQPEPLDPRGGIQAASHLGESCNDTVNPNQYENELNFRSHMRWTGPQILEQLPNIDCFAAGLGTSGTMTGIGTYLKQNKPSVTRIGVCTAAGDRVPGPRSYALLEPVQFPWRKAVDTIEEVGSKDSYQMSMNLSREGIVCGPSSGFNLIGLLNFLKRQKRSGKLHQLSTRTDGEVHCVFICCDLPYQYIDEYFSKLGNQSFPEITNKNLLSVDKYRYDEQWELPAEEFMPKLKRGSNASNASSRSNASSSNSFRSGSMSSSTSDTEDEDFEELASAPIVLDFRDFGKSQSDSLPGAIRCSIESLKKGQASPFSDPEILEAQWEEMESSLPMVLKTLAGKNAHDRSVLCVDYQGDTARMATSILRARGWEAWSLEGGMDGLMPSEMGVVIF